MPQRTIFEQFSINPFNFQSADELYLGLAQRLGIPLRGGGVGGENKRQTLYSAVHRDFGAHARRIANPATIKFPKPREAVRLSPNVVQSRGGRAAKLAKLNELGNDTTGALGIPFDDQQKRKKTLLGQ